MRFNQKGLIRVPSSEPDIRRYAYGLHSIIVVDDIISFSSFGEGEMPLDLKLAIRRHLGMADPIHLGSSVSADEADKALEVLKANGEDAVVIGRVVNGGEGVIIK